MSRTIEQLPWQQRLIGALPADPREDNIPRQVRNACYSRVIPTPVRAPRLLVLVPEVAELLDLDRQPTPALVQALAGNRLLPGMAPYSACYGGHQFGAWAGQLGDGRAITLGEVAGRSGETWELQLKGAGRTPYSRTADGRAVLRSSLRELVCSEAMFHLGVPTTRALSLVTTGEDVVRDLLYDGNPENEPGAVVCRVAPSFLRFGNFELHASRKEHDELSRLVRYTIEHYYPEYLEKGEPDIAEFFAEVCRRTARMIVEWMRVGFVHGVMNTDNMSILGLTIDYGPFGFVEPFDPDWTPNTTDAGGRRYRFGNQPLVAHWNLAQLGNALLPLAGELEPLERALTEYPETFGRLHHRMMLAKLGLSEDRDRTEEDEDLVSSLVTLLCSTEIDLTLFYRALAGVSLEAPQQPGEYFAVLQDAYYPGPEVSRDHLEELGKWLQRYAARAALENLADRERQVRMDAVNPLYVPRNYLLHTVIERTQRGDDTALPELLDVLRRPYTPQPGKEAFARKRPDWARNKPGCSMLSCSS